MLKKGLKKGFIYRDFGLQCEVCGERFKTPQGLAGHKKYKHNSADPKSPSPGGSSAPSVKELESEVKMLKLQVEKKKLTTELPSSSAETEDLMSRSGLGALDADVKAQAQRRAMGLTEQAPGQGWLDKLLANPAGVKLAVDGLKGILGVDRNSGDNLAGLLKDLGFNLKDLLLGASSPKAGALSIAGVDLTGVNLTPELLQGILQYKAAEEKAKQEFQGRKAMSDSLEKLIGLISPELIKRVIGNLSRGNGAAGGISQEISESVIVCELCKTQNPVPAGAEPGMVIHCQGPAGGPECSQSWIIEDPKAKQKPRKIKRPIEVKQPVPITVACPSCSQAIDVTDKAIGAVVRCGVCQEEFSLVSNSESIPGLDPLTRDEKRRKGYLE